MIFESLRVILEQERRTGFADRAVIGGLDSYLTEYDRQLRANPSGLKDLQWLRKLCVSKVAYASKNAAARQRWITKVLTRLSEPDEPHHRVRTSRKPALTPAGKRTHVKADDLHANGLDSSVMIVGSVTPKLGAKLAKLGLHTVRDLLYFFPRRHLDYSHVTPISELSVGEEQTVIGVVWEARSTMLGRRRSAEAVIGDDSGNVRSVWFNQPYMARALPANSRVVLSGKVTAFRNQLVFESPEWELVKDEDLIHTARLVPIYPLTQGLSARPMRKLAREAIEAWSDQLDEFIPESIRLRNGLLGRREAVEQAHFPDSQSSKEKARQRLAFDELILLQLGVFSRKKDWQESQSAYPIKLHRQSLEKFLTCLPFSFTAAQNKVLDEILDDISQGKAMSRLLQGEVGSGKTVVAAAALLMAVKSGHQAALMAPTEILAEQHYRTLSALLDTFLRPNEDQPASLADLRQASPIVLVVGSQSQKEKETLRGSIGRGEVSIVVGTHALIQEGVNFRSLALAVIDEQHRFGVLQRSALRQKGTNPHLLVMTATPIPRTLALTLYGDLDLSIINELPPGRQLIKTRFLGPEDRRRAYEFTRKQLKSGRQAFVICPLIEESESIDTKAAVAQYENLSTVVYPEFRVGLLHGKMPSDDKEAVMRQFRDGSIDILVSTSVVEVGIDVPNATVMIVEGADRFGLSQLHQFRGRVGRGKEQSYCIFLSNSASAEAKKRLSLMETTNDGFKLAEEDLKLRGPGEFFGVRQSGLPDLRMACLSDITILEAARSEAQELLKTDPELALPQNRLLALELARVWHSGKETS